MVRLMPVRKMILLAALTSVAAVALPLGLWAGESAEQGNASPKVILLHNGNVFHGEILEKGDLWKLKVGNGLIYVRDREIEAVASSLADIYDQRRGRLPSGGAEERIELAVWGAQHGLVEQARVELEEARRLQPDHPAIPLAQRRIEMASLGVPTAAIGSRARSADDELAPPLVNGPSAREELARLMRGLPGKTAPQFADTVQPILSNSCATANCHGPGAYDDIRLYSISRTGSAMPHETLHNLRTVLGWIDYREPGASPILDAPARPHGGLPAPVFAGRRLEQYRKLVDWVFAVTDHAEKSNEKAEERQPAQRQQRIGLDLGRMEDGNAALGTIPSGPLPPDIPDRQTIPGTLDSLLPQLRQDGMESPGNSQQLGSPHPLEQYDTRRPETSRQPQVPLRTPTPRFQDLLRSDRGNLKGPQDSSAPEGQPPPRGEIAPNTPEADPFDPMIFNRRYHASRLSGETARAARGPSGTRAAR